MNSLIRWSSRAHATVLLMPFSSFGQVIYRPTICRQNCHKRYFPTWQLVIIYHSLAPSDLSAHAGAYWLQSSSCYQSSFFRQAAASAGSASAAGGARIVHMRRLGHARCAEYCAWSNEEKKSTWQMKKQLSTYTTDLSETVAFCSDNDLKLRSKHSAE